VFFELFSFVKTDQKMGRFVVAAVVLAVSGIFFVSLILLILALLLCGYILFRAKTTAYRLVAIVFISFLVVIMGDSRHFRSFVLSHVYTPRAITPRNVIILNGCIEFVKGHKEFKSIVLRHGHILIEGKIYLPKDLLYAEKTKDFFTESNVDILPSLFHQLDSIRFLQFQRECDMVLFYKKANRILPTHPGVAYSLNGENPNEIEAEALDALKPFTKIVGNWYVSRKLLLRGPRSDIPTSIPKSLIDHSLRIDGIDPNELHKFD